MEDNNSETENNDSGSKRKSYPVRELTYFLETFVPKIYTDLGANVYHSKDQIAKATGLEVASIKQLLSTAQQYGLLELKHGTGYKVTPLFVKIYKPLNDAEKLSGIIQSIQSVEVFSKVINDFNGHVLTKNSISNNIERSFEIKDTIAQKVAEIFLANLKEYNLIGSDGTINFKGNNAIVNDPQDNSKPKEEDKPKNNDSVVKSNDQPEVGVTVIPIPLKSTNKKAYLHIPDGFTDEDLARIAKFVEALK